MNLKYLFKGSYVLEKNSPDLYYAFKQGLPPLNFNFTAYFSLYI
jgi:hypothetical protein